jgi:hypothetical protein
MFGRYRVFLQRPRFTKTKRRTPRRQIAEKALGARSTASAADNLPGPLERIRYRTPATVDAAERPASIYKYFAMIARAELHISYSPPQCSQELRGLSDGSRTAHTRRVATF